MARFLFVIVPVVARVWPAVAICEALTAMGHDVAFCGPEGDLRPLLDPRTTIYPTGKRSYRDLNGVGMAAVEELWDDYVVPLNRFIRRPVEDATAEFKPDVIFADQYAYAGALVAYQRGLPWATLCAGALELTPPAQLAGLQEWVDAKLTSIREKSGLSADDDLDLLFSPHLTIATTSRALTGTASIPANCVLVGAALGPRRTDPAFDWDWWDPDRRHVLVTAGTLSANMVNDYLARVMAALRPLGATVQAVFNVAAGAIADPPPHILVAPRVPMLDLMPRLDAVVCQAGQSTVNEALLNGVPLVVAPIRRGELPVAEQVARAGAGIEVSYSQASPAQLAAAVTAVLDEPAYRTQARLAGEQYAAEGGTKTAAAHLAALAARASGSI